MNILVAGASTFVGRNLIENLKNIKDRKNRTRPNLLVDEIYEDQADDADAVIVLPGASVDMTVTGRIICISKLNEATGRYPANALIYRLPEIVGKWQEGGVVASLCSAVANDEPYDIKDRNVSLEILFIEDFIEEIFDALEGHPHRCDFPVAGTMSCDPTAQYDGLTPVPNENGKYGYSPKTIRTTVGAIIDRLEAFNRLNTDLVIPEIPAGSLTYKLYSMYLSYLPERKMSYPLRPNEDERGIFTELIKTADNGQISINIARPGNVRGQHWHNTKWEIFIVVSGHGLIQERKIGTDPKTGKEYEIREFEVRGEEMKAVIMLPGYCHNIINLEKDRDLVTVMWANESFDPDHPDTFREEVVKR